MGDSRYAPYYRRVQRSPDAVAEVRSLSDEGVVSALAAASRAHDPYLANVLATEAMNRMLRARTIAGSIGEGVCTVDEEGRATSVNPAAERILGWSEAELLGRLFHESVHYQYPDASSYPLEDCPLNEALRDGATVETDEEVFFRKDGTQVPVTCVSAPIVREGDVVGAVIAFRDATQRRRLQQRIVESERRYRELYEDLPTMYFTADADGVVRSANRYGAERLGYSQAELEGRPLEEFFHPDDREVVRENLARVARGDAAHDTAEYDVRKVRKDGRILWVREVLRRVLDADGGSRVLVICDDITARKRAEALVAGQSEVLERVARGDPLGDVLAATARLVEAHADGMLVSILLYDRRSGVLRHGAAPSLPESYNRGIDGLEPGPSAGSCGTAVHTGAPVYVSDIAHDERWATWRNLALAHGLRASWSTPFKTASGDVLGTFALYYREPREPTERDMDLTRIGTYLAGIAVERHRTEEENRRLHRELEERVRERTRALAQANQELEAFSYTVSHDLRAPLRGIDALSRALAEDYADNLDEDGRAYLARLRAESTRMTQLVNDLLNLSGVMRGDLRRERVDVTALARSIVDALRRASPGRDVEVVVQPGLEADADARLLRVALENLIGNAWKYTSKTPRARIEVGRETAHGRRAFYVRDNGAGFEPEKAGRLFTAFQRLHAPTEFEGTGVGLATVRRIVNRHGGRVWAEGEPGAGATFWFTLPAGLGVS